MSRWNEGTTFNFVNEYLKYEALWNVKSELYKNRQAKQTAYANLEKAMNIPGFTEKEIKTKIKNIRSTYSQELKKIKESKKSGSGTDSVYIPSIKWFQMADDILRNIQSELRGTQSNFTQNTEFAHTDDTNRNETQQSTCVSPEIPVQESNETPLETSKRATQEAPQTSRHVPKRQRIGQLKSVVNQLKGIAEAVNAPVEENEFEVFGKNVGLQLKGMPLELALEAQQHIQTYLNNLRLQHLASQNTKDSYQSHPIRRFATLPSSPPFSESRSMTSTPDSDRTTTWVTPENEKISQDFNPPTEALHAGTPGDPELTELTTCESQLITQCKLPQNDIIFEALTGALHAINP